MKLNKIYNMDVNKFLKTTEIFADLIIADPPYNISIDKWDTFESETKFLDFTYEWLDNAINKLNDGGSIYIFNTPYNCAKILTYLSANENMEFINWITWYKKDGFSANKSKYNSSQETILFFRKKGPNFIFNYDDIREPYLSTDRMKHAAEKGIIKNGKRWFPNPNGRLSTDVWEFSSHRHNVKNKGKLEKSFHPTPKPELLIEKIVKASSNEKSVVFDLFSGSGTTSVISKKLNRTFIGCELDVNYVEYINERLK